MRKLHITQYVFIYYYLILSFCIIICSNIWLNIWLNIIIIDNSFKNNIFLSYLIIKVTRY